MGSPIRVEKVGNVQAAVFENKVGENTIQSVVCSKSYQDKDEKWQNSNSFKMSEIPFVIRALQKVWDARYIKEEF